MGALTAYESDFPHARSQQMRSLNLAAVTLFSCLFLPSCRNQSAVQEWRSPNSVFHFSRIHRGDSLPIAMTRHQHLLFSQLSLKPKQRVLALFCGNGTTCEQLVHFSDVNVVGIDTDAHLISQARVAAEDSGLVGRLTYHHARDVCEALEKFPDGSFDAVFAIELGYRSASPTTLYRHIERLLKPSGRFAIYEWCFTEAMTQANTEHVAAAQNLLRSFPNMAQRGSVGTIPDLVSTLREAGLENIVANDLALREKGIPWYRPLESYQSSQPNSCLSLSWWYGQLSIAALLNAGRLQIFSPMVLVTGEKDAKRL